MNVAFSTDSSEPETFTFLNVFVAFNSVTLIFVFTGIPVNTAFCPALISIVLSADTVLSPIFALVSLSYTVYDTPAKEPLNP